MQLSVKPGLFDQSCCTQLCYSEPNDFNLRISMKYLSTSIISLSSSNHGINFLSCLFSLNKFLYLDGNKLIFFEASLFIHFISLKWFFMQVIEAQVDMPIVGAIALYVSLLTFTLRVHPDRLDYVDQVLVYFNFLSYWYRSHVSILLRSRSIYASTMS